MSSSPLTIYLATDHAGFAHKNIVRDWLTNEGFNVIDMGAITYDEADDFPDYIAKAAAAISVAPQHKAVIFGGSGQGEAMLANRFKNVRAAVYYGGPDEVVTLSREHNDANVLSIGARFVSSDEAMRVIWDWLHLTPELDERHVRRIKKMEAVSSSYAQPTHEPST